MDYNESYYTSPQEAINAITGSSTSNEKNGLMIFVLAIAIVLAVFLIFYISSLIVGTEGSTYDYSSHNVKEEFTKKNNAAITIRLDGKDKLTSANEANIHLNNILERLEALKRSSSQFSCRYMKEFISKVRQEISKFTEKDPEACRHLAEGIARMIDAQDELTRDVQNKIHNSNRMLQEALIRNGSSRDDLGDTTIILVDLTGLMTEIKMLMEMVKKNICVNDVLNLDLIYQLLDFVEKQVCGDVNYQAYSAKELYNNSTDKPTKVMKTNLALEKKLTVDVTDKKYLDLHKAHKESSNKKATTYTVPNMGGKSSMGKFSGATLDLAEEVHVDIVKQPNVSRKNIRGERIMTRS